MQAQHLALGHRGRLAIVVAQRQGCAGECLLFAGFECQRLHPIFTGIDPVEVLQNDLAHHVAGVTDPQVLHRVAADQPVVANVAVHPAEHLVGTRPVMGIDQNDLVGLRAVDLALVAHPNHVLGEIQPVLLPHPGLDDHEGLETLLAQPREQVGGSRLLPSCYWCKSTTVVDFQDEPAQRNQGLSSRISARIIRKNRNQTMNIISYQSYTAYIEYDERGSNFINSILGT